MKRQPPRLLGSDDLRKKISEDDSKLKVVSPNQGVHLPLNMVTQRAAQFAQRETESMSPVDLLASILAGLFCVIEFALQLANLALQFAKLVAEPLPCFLTLRDAQRLRILLPLLLGLPPHGSWLRFNSW